MYLVVPQLEETDLLAITRLGWIAVLFISGVESLSDARVLLRRLGVAGLSAAVAVLMAAFLIRRVESPENGFDTLGESLWWAVVTITTVGYGDRVPETAGGRIVATLLMAGGLTFLGVVAASLAAHFGFIDDEVDRPRRRDDEQLTELLVEVRALRAEVARLAGDRPDEVDDEPSLPSGDDSSASGSDPPSP